MDESQAKVDYGCPPPWEAELAVPCPEGYVPLHHLCEKCRPMIQDLCSHIEDTKVLTDADVFWKYTSRDTVTDLIARSGQCHMCTLLSHRAQNDGSIEHIAPESSSTILEFQTYRRRWNSQNGRVLTGVVGTGPCSGSRPLGTISIQFYEGESML